MFLTHYFSKRIHGDAGKTDAWDDVLTPCEFAAAVEQADIVGREGYVHEACSLGWWTSGGFLLLRQH
jgi:hypothetical protein